MSAFDNVGAQGVYIFHFACTFNGVGLGADVVQIAHDGRFLDARQYGASVFPQPMMWKDAMYDPFDFFGIYTSFLQLVLQFVRSYT